MRINRTDKPMIEIIIPLSYKLGLPLFLPVLK